MIIEVCTVKKVRGLNIGEAFPRNCESIGSGMRLPSLSSSAFERAICTALAACGLALLPPAPLYAAPPSAEAQITLRKGFQAVNSGLLGNADALLSQSAKEWVRTGQPSDELAAILKARGSVRQQLGMLEPALEDLSESLKLNTKPDAGGADPAEIQRTYVLRARVLGALERWRAAEQDLTAAIDRLDSLDAIEATNPYLFSERSAARSRLGDFAGAAEDALQAEVEFKMIGDKVRRVISAADAALAMYADEPAAAVQKMRYVFKNKGIPASNNPDDIGLLQELSRKDAELHLAYAGHLYGAEDKRSEAETQWTSGCVRLEAYVQDGAARAEEEASLRAAEAKSAEEQGRATTLRAASVASQPLGPLSPNSDFNAWLNGLDPKSPYVTQRPQQNYFWYKTGEGEIERRDAGNALATVDLRLSCGQFRKEDWLQTNRPEWPPALVENTVKYVRDVPQQAIVMPPKNAPPTKGELVY